MNLDQLTEEVLRRLQAQKPRVLLLGTIPRQEKDCCYVHDPPYEQIMIGILPPGELLQMPSDLVCDALLQGMPVALWPQPYGKGKNAILLRKSLAEAEQRLIRYGAQPVITGQWWKERQDGCRNCNGKLLGDKEM